MSLLNRLILAGFFRLFALSLGAFVGVFLLIDFFEKVDDFIEHGARLTHYLLYFANSIPIALVQIIPLAVLLAAFGTVGSLSRTNELTAMRSGGVSLLRITLPIVGAALLISITVLAANEFLIPLNQKKTRHILNIEVKGKQPIFYKRDRIWFREGSTITNVLHSNPKQQRLQGVSIFSFDEAFRLTGRMDAPDAAFESGKWTFRDLRERTFHPSSGQVSAMKHYGEKEMPLSKKPEEFKKAIYQTKQMGFRELGSLVKKLQQEGYDAKRYQVDMHSRLAQPFACLVMALLGIPFALRKGRGASLPLGMTFTVGIGIVYYILQAIMQAFGYSAVLPPPVAAWSPLLLFSLLALWLMVSSRD